MQPPHDPPDEAERLASLKRLNILDTPDEERFDRVTRLASRLFEVPIVAISLVDEDRQWFKSIHGLQVKQTPRSVSFCGHTILGDGAMIVEDAQEDPRFADNPLVTGDPDIGFYAGHPLTTADGQKVGTLCLIDRRPRSLSDADLTALRDLATITENELNIARFSRAQQELLSQLEEAERRSLLDPLTSLWNRAGVMKVLDREMAYSRREGVPLSVVIADVDHFKRVNDDLGHLAGDEVLREIARRLRSSQRASDMVGRIGGEEFLIVLPECGAAGAAHSAERARAAVARQPVVWTDGGAPRILEATISLGVAAREPGERLEIGDLLRLADEALYRAKDSGRNRVECAQGAPADGLRATMRAT